MKKQPTFALGARTGLYGKNSQKTPKRRSSPLLIKQWKYLWRREFVELRRGQKVVNTGRVDEVTADGTTLWIHLSNGLGRIMLHQCDAIDVWRVDAHIYQNRDLDTH